MIVKTPFFISPAYSVPRITNSPRSKSRLTLVGRAEVPASRGSAGNSPALKIT